MREPVHVRISPLDGGGHAIEVDGHHVENMTEHLTLEMDSRDRMPVLTLRLVSFRPDADTHAVVRLDEQTREALKAMGWTPPEEG